nr:PilZ domain-containing protein [uncultured Desulfobulbus sp.]
MDQRKHPRVRVRGMSIDISDGIGCCSASVSDVSRGGLCLADLGKRFGKKSDRFTVVATTGEDHFKFQVKPRWERLSNWNKKIGLEIDNAPLHWIAYVRRLESQRLFI